MTDDRRRPVFTDGSVRPEWVGLLARLTDGFARAIPTGGSPAAASLPGAPPGDQVPSIEGFARMSVAWAAWLREPSNPSTVSWDGRAHDVAHLLALGLRDATDPSGPFWWGEIGDRDQRIVELAEIATALWLGGERLRRALDNVDPAAHDRILDWLALVDGRDVWPDNWVLFPMIGALVRRLAGRAVDLAAVDAAVDAMVGLDVGDGWTSDGAGHALDLYSGWAIHWHLLWWATIDGARRPRLRATVIRRARAWLRFVAPLVAADGGFPRFGRSLGYRFALAAPFAQAALLGIDPLPSGNARSAAGRLVGRALADGAIDPSNDWLRVGVGGERPAVVERYVSAGAVAWAAHAFVGLALPEAHPFWHDTAEPPVAPAHTWTLAAAGAGLLAAGSPAGGTRLHNARTGHPADIPGHDYSATYGKLVYRSAFPFDVPVAKGASAGSDDAIVAIEDAIDGRADTLVHRNESSSGSAGPGWITTAYRLATRRPARLRTTVLLLDDVEVRITAVRPGSPIRLRDGGAALGTDGRARSDIVEDRAARMIAVFAGDRSVAIRALAGYDGIGTSASAPDRMNLIDKRSTHPWVEETRPSAGPRVVISATTATIRGVDVPAVLRAFDVAVDTATGFVHVAWPGGQSAIASVGRHSPTRLEIAGRTVRGPALRVVIVADDGSRLAGERIQSIEGVCELSRPGIVEVARVGSTVEATVASGDPPRSVVGRIRARLSEGPGRGRAVRATDRPRRTWRRPGSARPDAQPPRREPARGGPLRAGMTVASRDPGHPLAGLLTVMWHYVRDPSAEPRVGATWIEPADFDAQLDLIGRHRTVVGWPDVAAALDGGPPLPRDAALLTFDDGLVDHVRTVAPRLRDRGWTGVFFVLARAPGERLTVGHAIHILLADLGQDGLRTAVEDELPVDDADRFRAAQRREQRANVEPIDVLKRPLQRDLVETVAPILSRLVGASRGPDGDVADALHQTPADVAAMRQDGLTIGGHGRRHVWFDHEPADRVVAELPRRARPSSRANPRRGRSRTHTARPARRRSTPCRATGSRPRSTPRLETRLVPMTSDGSMPRVPRSRLL